MVVLWVKLALRCGREQAVLPLLGQHIGLNSVLLLHVLMFWLAQLYVSCTICQSVGIIK